MVEKSRCSLCKAIMPKYFLGKRLRKFCSSKCATRSNSIKFYQENKDKPEFKRRNYETSQEWINSHRDRWNERMRIHNLEFQRKKRIEWKKNGLCRTCGKEKMVGYSSCLECREKKRSYPSYIQRYKKYNKVKQKII